MSEVSRDLRERLHMQSNRLRGEKLELRILETPEWYFLIWVALGPVEQAERREARTQTTDADATPAALSHLGGTGPVEQAERREARTTDFGKNKRDSFSCN